MKLYINSKPAIQGQVVTSSTGKVGKLLHWTEPQKPKTPGEVYVQFDGEDFVNKFFPSTINGSFNILVKR